MLKKFLYTLSCAAIILLNTTVVKADEIFFTNREHIEMTEAEYNNLLQLGFTEAQIYRMDYQTFIDNKDIEATLLSETTKYIKTTVSIRNGITTSVSSYVTEAEFNNGVAQLQQPSASLNVFGSYYNGASGDYYRSMSSKIVNINDYTMRYKVDLQWENMPSTRSWDIMAIGIEPAKVQIGSSLMARQDWETTNNVYGYSEGYMIKEEDYGGSVMFELPSGSLQVLESYLYFNVIKQSGIGTLYSIGAVGDYAHAVNTISDEDDAYDNYWVTYGGINIDTPYSNSYDNMLEAEAVFVGEW